MVIEFTSQADYTFGKAFLERMVQFYMPGVGVLCRALERAIRNWETHVMESNDGAQLQALDQGPF